MTMTALPIGNSGSGPEATATLDPASEIRAAIDVLIAAAPVVWEGNPAPVIAFLEELKEIAL
jgi:hypothetical protein